VKLSLARMLKHQNLTVGSQVFELHHGVATAACCVNLFRMEAAHNRQESNWYCVALTGDPT